MATEAQLVEALKRADAAGATDDARKLAQAIGAMRKTAQPTAPVGRVEAASAVGDATPASGVGRQLGLGARATAEGLSALPGVVYDAAGGVTNLGVMGLNALGVGLPYVRRASENIASVANAAGLPTPETTGERLMSAGVRGASSVVGSPAPSIGNAVLGGLGAAVGEGVYQATENPWLAAGADVLTNLGGAATAATTRGAFRGGDQGRARVQSAIDDFAVAGASPTAGQATGASGINAIESTLGRLPVAAGIVRRKGEATTDAIGNALTDISGGVTPDAAGRAIGSGIKNFVERFQTKASDLYNEVDRFVPPTAAADISNTQAALARLTNPVPGAARIGETIRNPKIKAIADAITADAGSGSVLPYDALKQLRTAVGQMVTDGDLVTAAPRAQVKQLYAALSEDMKAAAQAAGPEATRAFNRAQQYYRSGLGRIEGSLDRLAKIADPEKLATALGRGDTKTLLAARRSLTDSEWLDVARAQAGQLGLARAGQQNAEGTAASIETFLTNWNKLGKPAQDALFAGIPGNPSMAEDLRKIAKASNAVRESSRVLSNPSGTAAATSNLTAGGLLLYNLGAGNTPAVASIIGGAGGAAALAKLMTSPRFVKFLARATEVPVERLPSLVGRLNQMADSDEENADTLRALAESITASGGQNANR